MAEGGELKPLTFYKIFIKYFKRLSNSRKPGKD
jgi:hypothetical protein